MSPATEPETAPAPAFVRARRRAWAALTACLVGVWLSVQIGGGSAWWFGLSAAAAGVAGVAGPRRWWAPAWLAAVLLAGGWGAVRFREPPPDRLDRLVAEGSIVTLTGTAAGTPERLHRPTGPGAPGAWRDDGSAFTLRVSGLRGAAGPVPARGSLRVFGPVALEEAVRPGDRVSVSGVYRRPGAASNPGEPDWTRLGNEAGRAGSLSVGNPDLVVVTERPEGLRAAWSGLNRGREALRRRALDALGVDGRTAGGGVVGALVLGEHDPAFDRVYRVFQRSGVAHVLAVSGFHVALLCGLAALAVRLTGDRGRLETAAVLVVILAMLLLIPTRSPILRACVLALALILGDASGRRWDRLALLAWAGVGLLVWKPSEALSLGYLLSVGVTALLLALAERDRRERWSLLARPRPDNTGPARRAARQAGRWFWGACRLNTACWAASAPTIIAKTGVFSLLAPVATVAIVPLAGVLLALGWLQAMLGVCWPAAASWTRPVVQTLGDWTGAIAAWFDGLPGSSVLIAGLGWWWAAFATAGVLGWLFWKARRPVFVAMLALSAAYAIAMASASGRVDGLRADMLDVGDGTSVLVRSGREAILWDAGSLQREVGDRVADAVLALGVRRIDTAVLTHPDLDHYNALPVVAERLGLRRVLMPQALLDHASEGWLDARARMGAMGVVFVGLRAGDRLDLGDATGEVLWPPPERPARGVINESSLVVRWTIDTPAGARSLLLTGDVQRAGIAGLEAAGVSVRATVSEVPHHGSAIPAAIHFMERVAPAVALQSTGPSRLGDERWDAVRARTAWLSTAERGAVFAWLRADGSLDAGAWDD